MRILAGIALLGALGAGPAWGGSYQTVHWPELKAEIYGDAELRAAGERITLDAPRRSVNDAEVPISVSARLLDGEGIRSVTLIIDENPMPVSAVWTFDQPRQSVTLGANLRFDGPSPLRAVIETTGGARYITERFVKTSGLATCSAPPVGDPKAALATIGQMQLFDKTAPNAAIPNRLHARLEMKHPQHTGMQRDQITLHYILARYVDEVEVFAGEQRLFTLTGSISLSEDPEIGFDFPNTGTETLRV
ncbi:MAG: quinoprotein dehydrogenase-associated SoxYZ-like carrier, partial [Pseudomonadota bacterium]